MADLFEFDNFDEWDRLIDNSVNGTIYHKNEFLSYHGAKFKNVKYLAISKENKVIGQLCFTIDENDGYKTLKSPFGASYGGFVFQDYPSYQLSKEISHTFIDYVKGMNINRVLLTFPTSPCSNCKSLDTFYFSLLENGFKVHKRDVSSVVYLKDYQTTSFAKKMMKKAVKNNVSILKDAAVTDFYEVLHDTYLRLNAKPTHTVEELIDLKNRFPNDIFFSVGYFEDKPVAGICYFKINKHVMCTFYLCQKTDYRNLQGLSMLVYQGIEDAKANGFNYYDLGTSTMNFEGKENIFSFKEHYTKIGCFRDTYELTIL